MNGSKFEKYSSLWHTIASGSINAVVSKPSLSKRRLILIESWNDIECCASSPAVHRHHWPLISCEIILWFVYRSLTAECTMICDLQSPNRMESSIKFLLQVPFDNKLFDWQWMFQQVFHVKSVISVTISIIACNTIAYTTFNTKIKMCSGRLKLC